MVRQIWGAAWALQIVIAVNPFIFLPRHEENLPENRDNTPITMPFSPN